MQGKTKNWYADWFDTDFYHILYQDRDYEEAALFMKNLTNYLNLPPKASVLDVACGKGRHALYLNQLGFTVTGIDLSENNIRYAKQFENDSLHFEVYNMCLPYPKKFDAVFNLFTSFGYFEEEGDNFSTITAFKANLKKTGFAVIDFMNVEYVMEHLVAEDVKRVGGIDFHQKRFVKEGYIVKEINFNHENHHFHFTERVKALTLSHFETYFRKASIDLLDVFGDYKLQKFQPQTSQRLILIFK
jgi:SAM-dependent methyltransferase